MHANQAALFSFGSIRVDLRFNKRVCDENQPHENGVGRMSASVSRLNCPGCSAPVEPPEGRSQFFCRFCGATVVVPEEPLADNSAADKGHDGRLHPLPSLDRLQIERSSDRMTLRWQWRTWVAFVMIPFALFWNGFLVVITTMLVGSGDLWPLLFLSLFYGVGLFLIYFCAAMLVNGTTITVDGSTIAVSHGPLPWKTPSPVPVGDIEQLFVKETLHRGKERTTAQYSLELVRKSGSTVTLLSGEYDADMPRTIERLLETHLGIDDRSVKGEYEG